MLKFKKNPWVFKMHAEGTNGWGYRSVKLSDLANAGVGDLLEGRHNNDDYSVYKLLKVTYKSNKFIEFDVFVVDDDTRETLEAGSFCFNLKSLMVEWYTTQPGNNGILWGDFLHENIPQMHICGDMEWRY